MSISLSSITLVKTSKIHGKGLFASKKILKEQLIGYFKGHKTTEDGPYVLWMDESLSIEVEGPLKYINHSNSPNACYYDDLTVMALKDIMKGEEITHNYGDDWH